jgi:hypothetical protein
MSIKNALASIAFRDLNSAVQWYQKVLGTAPDSRPMPEVAEWKFERGGWLVRRSGRCEPGPRTSRLWMAPYLAPAG